MVTPEGLLPNQKITDSYVERVRQVVRFESRIALTILSLSRTSSASLTPSFSGSFGPLATGEACLDCYLRCATISTTPQF